MSASSSLTFSELKAIFESMPQCRELGFEVVEVRKGKAFMRLPYQQRLVGNPETGVLHGGVLTTMMDTVAALAATTVTPDNTAVATLDLRIDYLRPAAPGQTLRGVAEYIKRTRNVIFVHGAAYHDTVDDPVAHMAATFMINELPAAAGTGKTGGGAC